MRWVSSPFPFNSNSIYILYMSSYLYVTAPSSYFSSFSYWFPSYFCLRPSLNTTVFQVSYAREMWNFLCFHKWDIIVPSWIWYISFNQDEDNKESSLKSENLVQSSEENYESNDCDHNEDSKSSVGRSIIVRGKKPHENESNTCSVLNSSVIIGLKKFTVVKRVDTIIFLNNKVLINSSDVENPLKKISCSSCEYKTDNKTCLEHHMATHSDNFSCLSCDFKSKNREILNSHMLTHPKELTFSCSGLLPVKVRITLRIE